MRILVFSHQHPADEPGGVGLFAHNVAATMRLSGHQVTLITGASGRPRQPAPGAEVVDQARGCWLQRTPDEEVGLPTLRLMRAPGRGGHTAEFLGSFLHRGVEQLVERLLQREQPEVVHIQHTLNLSAKLGPLARRRGAAVVSTVHDFWPLCQRIDLVHPAAGPCPGPAGGLRCAGCLPPARGELRGALNPWDALHRARTLARHAAEMGGRLGPYLLRTQLVQGSYASSHRITCPAPFVSRLLQQAGFDGQRLRVVDYGIPMLPPSVALASRPHTPFRWGYLGTMGPHKGLWVLLQAVEQLARSQPRGWELSIHGGPLRSPQLRRQLTEVSDRHPGRVTYHGPYTPERLPALLQRLDAVVIPSVWRETGPMVLMEATAAGLPVVASHVGGLAERVQHDSDGLLVPPGAAEPLADAMVQLMARYDELRRGALAAPVRSVDQAAGELCAVYDEALAARETHDA